MRSHLVVVANEAIDLVLLGLRGDKAVSVQHTENRREGRRRRPELDQVVLNCARAGVVALIAQHFAHRDNDVLDRCHRAVRSKEFGASAMPNSKPRRKDVA
jgi:hypothetical protein